ncbi:MAG: hypothetical protein JWQ98_1011 [Chlorobi bacterium]|nr:hypothetical protein [Chlorobiota bacterium]
MTLFNRIVAGLTIASAITLSAFVGGCTDTPTSTGGNSTTITPAKQGSTFTSYTYSKDSLGQMQQGSQDTTVSTIAKTGLTIGGKSDVNMAIGVKKSGGTDTTYFRYESNGDVSLYFNATDSSGGAPPMQTAWITLPFASKTSMNLTIVDTAMSDSTFGAGRFKVTSSAVQTGTENITVGSETLSAEKVQWKFETSATFGLFGIGQSVVSTIWFAPKIGFIARQEQITSEGIPGFLSVSGSSYQNLVAYSLK